jgi:diguanylate cyclase (GGDEF)-like protein
VIDILPQIAGGEMPRAYSEPVQKILDVMQHQRLSVLFQPVIDLASSHIIGYEGQIRGPSDDMLHSPVRLFRLAKQADKFLDLENHCCQLTVESFVEQELQGILFLRLNVEVFLEHKFKEILVSQAIEKSGLDMQRLVVTLCVHEPYDNHNFLIKIIARFTELGYKVALEDQGEIFSMLQSYPANYPSCVKINPYLIQDIDKDPVKVQLLKSILEQANNSGFITIADGIETRGELLLAKQLGFTLCQGGFIGRPCKKPARVTPRDVCNLLAVKSSTSKPSAEGNSIDSILEKAPSFSLDKNNEEVFQVFEKNPHLTVAAVTNNKVPIGLINRSVFVSRYARPYQRELYGKKTCSTFMDPDPLIVDRNISIQALSAILAEDQRHVSLGFIFTENGVYLGVGTSQKLIHEITEMQIQSARYANPLTGLPGNAPIDDFIDLLLSGEESFCVCYFDLDNFKPFNDVYGFSMGDSMIQLTAKIISDQCDPEMDFVGHIGGDDFIVLFRSLDWESRCNNMLEKFAIDVMSFFSKQDIERGGYVTENRRGEKEFHNLTSLSVGALPVNPKGFKSHRDIAVVATESKKMAKKMPGNSLYVNQRNYAEHVE